jgi:hypothetical protein
MFTAEQLLPSLLMANYKLRGCSPSAAVLYLDGSRGTYSVCRDLSRHRARRRVAVRATDRRQEQAVRRRRAQRRVRVFREGGSRYYAANLSGSKRR